MKTQRLKPWNAALGVLICCALMTAAGCSDDEEAVGEGSLTVLLESEDTITQGLTPGEGTENIRDGWTVTFDKYITVVGDIDVYFSTNDGQEMEAPDVFAVDMTKVPEGGLALWDLKGLQAGRWEFNYSTLGAGDGAAPHESVAQADFDQMAANDWTYLIDGVLAKADGQSCPPAALVNVGDKTPNGNKSGDNDCFDAPSIRFTFGVSAETYFGPCEIDEVAGFAISDGGTQTVGATIHGDHIFFNGFPEGDEGGVTRLAQWLADSDLNLDGTVTAEELGAIAPSQLPEIDARYQLGGSPITPLNNMYDYVTSQLKTQGHYQGEGECPVDGVAHEHGHGEDDHDHEGEDHDHEDEDHDHEGEDHEEGEDHDHEDEDHDHEGE